MINNFFILLRQELLISAIIFILLFIKLGKDRSNESILHVINLLICLNFAAGFIPMLEGELFNSMFATSKLVVLEKNILNWIRIIKTPRPRIHKTKHATGTRRQVIGHRFIDPHAILNHHHVAGVAGFTPIIQPNAI